MATYTIREVAQRFHVQTSTLRYYEDQGLLCDVERDDAGRRVYTDSHIGRLEAIACFKHAGMSIDELKRFFAYEKDERAHIADMLELLESRHQAILKQRAALEEAYMHVLRKLHLYRDIQDRKSVCRERV